MSLDGGRSSFLVYYSSRRKQSFNRNAIRKMSGMCCRCLQLAGLVCQSWNLNAAMHCFVLLRFGKKFSGIDPNDLNDKQLGVVTMPLGSPLKDCTGADGNTWGLC